MKDCYIFDLDGTLADISHRLHHIQGEEKNWAAFYAACGKDPPIDHMCRLVRSLAFVRTPIVYVSGRSDECREETVRWLDANEMPYHTLYMRKAGDYRPDDVVKLELLGQLRADGYRPIMAFEDRSRVVAAWRKAGIPCAQVAEGEF